MATTSRPPRDRSRGRSRSGRATRTPAAGAGADRRRGPGHARASRAAVQPPRDRATASIHRHRHRARHRAARPAPGPRPRDRCPSAATPRGSPARPAAGLDRATRPTARGEGLVVERRPRSSDATLARVARSACVRDRWRACLHGAQNGLRDHQDEDRDDRRDLIEVGGVHDRVAEASVSASVTRPCASASASATANTRPRGRNTSGMSGRIDR